jgi:hypothetical protein
LSEKPEPATEDPTALAQRLSLTDGQRRGRCLWFKGVLPAAENETLEEAAWLIAEATMRHRCEGASHVFDLWRAAAKGEHDLSEREAESIEPFLRTAFGLPDQPRPDDHVQGYVAEMTWFLVTSEVVRENRTLVYLKGPDFHVTGPGGDGLVVYDIDDALAFRLWEIKKHTGSSRVSTRFPVPTDSSARRPRSILPSSLR